MVKTGCGQSDGETLKLTGSEEWTNGINWFLHVETDSQKLKVIKIFLGGHGQKWVWSTRLWDSKIDFISKINRWYKLIFCMLVQI